MSHQLNLKFDLHRPGGGRVHSGVGAIGDRHGATPWTLAEYFCVFSAGA